MIWINLYKCTFICAIVLTLTNTILGQQSSSSFLRKPWPTYSLQNMPQTQFTCHDKILGGYYADQEAQCQMFHVCVKVAGVGVQDFRFLCPNGTAFDQEAQICADWGDVDCDQSVLYYGSDNFDLYRLGSGFESKRAPLAEEDESTFHLQRAESGDVRRFKETRIDQQSRPDQPPNYTKHFETVTRGSFNNFNNNNNNKNNNNVINTQQRQNVKIKKQKLQQTEVTKKPIISYYTPTSTTTTTERNYNDDSKQDFDDIFKGSHSSNFFSNRNGGHEDDFLDHPTKPSLKPNDFSDFSKKSQASTIGKSRVTPTRPKRPLQTSTTLSSSTTTSTIAPLPAKKVTQHSFYNTDFHDYSQYKSTISTSQSFASTVVTTPRTVQGQNNANRFNIGLNDFQTQAKIQPTTYNPNRYKSSTAKYPELKRDKTDAISYNKPTGIVKKTQKFEQTQQKLSTQNSTFVRLNEFNEFAKIKPQLPQPFQPQPPAKIFEAPARPSLEPQYFRSRGHKHVRVNDQQPEPFRAPPKQAFKTTEKVIKEKPTVPAKAEAKPRGFVSRGSINYKATTQKESETYPTTTSNSHKKFSTLVPKDKYAPTTFKPSTYKKTYENNLYQTQHTVRPANQPQKSSTTYSSTTLFTTPNPYYNVDEDDGQYHPELYEINYSRSNFNRQRQPNSPNSSSTSTSTVTTPKPFKQNFNNPVKHLKSQQQTSLLKEQTSAADLSDEDELFKTAQSLNFGAASINKLRADIFKAEKTSQQYNSQYNPHNSITSPKATTSSTPFTTSPLFFTNPSYSTTTQTTSRPTTFLVPSSTTTPSTSTTTQPTTKATSTKHTTAYPYHVTKSGKHASDKLEKKSKKNETKNKKKTSKKPLHADEDTSYDYAYYDSDTLSETPQEYPEYEIQEFTKTKTN